MKLMWDSACGFYSILIEDAHELALEAEEPWRRHGPYAFETVMDLRRLADKKGPGA